MFLDSILVLSRNEKKGMHRFDASPFQVFVSMDQRLPSLPAMKRTRSTTRLE